MHGLKVLDCTLRDGGYYNDWSFGRGTVDVYLHAMEQARIDVIEIGFRSFPRGRFLGPYAFSTDSLLDRLPLPETCRVAVMVDAKELVGHPGGAECAVDALFRPADGSRVSLVRVATLFTEAEPCCPALSRLKSLGYQVAINLMQAGGRDSGELTRTAEMIASWGIVDVLYFADSFGNMDPASTASTVAALRRGWSGPIGFHAHDNMGQAQTNTLAAIDAGASWVDGTVLGMGRGAGNARMEHLLLALAQRGLGSYRAEALFHVVLEDFSRLQKRHGWGNHLFYYLSATLGIHPTYVQTMLADERYANDEVLAGLMNLGGADGGAYCPSRLEDAMRPRAASFSGNWSARDWAGGRTVLIVGPGPSVAEHLDELVDFIDREGPGVIVLNAKTLLPPDRVSAYATCNPVRMAVEGGMYAALGRPVIMPVAALSSSARDTLASVPLLDYGLTVEAGRFHPEDRGCVVPHHLVAAYALAFANAAGAGRVLLAGFDGFTPSEYRHKVMLEVFELYGRTPGLAPLRAVTPTSYPISQSSVYALELEKGPSWER
ncbi:MAG: aldolase catalytic domain-containing protein [Alphaproteobacteria bacterium]|nr:aldolase catalytic domain-containing protein [Alphaproteobacteria bacterium]